MIDRLIAHCCEKYGMRKHPVCQHFNGMHLRSGMLRTMLSRELVNAADKRPRLTDVCTSKWFGVPDVAEVSFEPVAGIRGEHIALCRNDANKLEEDACCWTSHTFLVATLKTQCRLQPRKHHTRRKR